MKKLFLLCISLLCLCYPVYAKEGIYSINIDVYIDNSGNANITETWICESYSGTEWYHPYYNLGNAQITNLSVSENSKNYQLLSSWDTDKSQSYKTEKCGLNRISNGIEICWGMGAYGKHEYKVNYTITNFVDQLNDCQMIYWTLIPHDRSDRVDNANIKIYTDKSFTSDFSVWGFGEDNGTCKINDGYIEMTSKNGLAKTEYMTILAKIPTNFFNTTNISNKNFDYYYDMAIKGTTLDKKNSDSDNAIIFLAFFLFIMFLELVIPVLITLLLSTMIKGLSKITINTNPVIAALFWSAVAFALFTQLWILIIILFIVSLVACKLIKEKKVLKGKIKKSQVEYYRDIPCNKDLFKSYYLAYQYGLIKNETDLLGAIILKWIKEKKASVIDKDFDNKNDYIKIEREHSSWVWDNTLEKQLYLMMYEASGDGILEKKELKKWCNNKFNKLFTWFNNVLDCMQQELIKNNEIILEKKGGVIKYNASDSLFEEAQQICGLKKYLEDFSLIHEREAIEVHLYEEYLILAQMLGIAKKVSKQFNELYPQILEASSFEYNDYIFVDSISHRSIRSARYARTRSDVGKAMASASRSFGGGGGGSRGGGGGGGGRR